MSEQAAEKDPAPESDERWKTAVDWLLNHRDSYDTAPLFFAYVDGIITREELQAEQVDDVDAEGLPKGIHQVVNERRAAAEDRVTPPAVGRGGGEQ